MERLVKEGYRAFAGDTEEEIALILTEKQIRRLFGAGIRYRTVAASSREGMVTEPLLEGARIPKRYGRVVRSVYLDPQRS